MLQQKQSPKRFKIKIKTFKTQKEYISILITS